MRAQLKKLANNLLTIRAVSVLGLRAYIYYVGMFILLLPKIAARGDLSPLDEAMSGKLSTFKYRGAAIHFDTGYCDRHIKDGTFAFGSVRELLIRDCYFRYLPDHAYADAKVVVDLGANRGAFSSLVAHPADRVISVEASKEYLSAIQHNMRLNGAADSVIEIVFVGNGGLLAPADLPRLTMDELFTAHDLRVVDLMKVDIEGSEFDLFSGPALWLDRVRMITMETHSNFGETQALLTVLVQRGFDYILANNDLRRIDDPQLASFVYAWRRG